MPEIEVTTATADDATAILALLRRCGLPTAGFVEDAAIAVVARRAADVIGSAALEVHAHGALLRSVAVDASARGMGVGHRLTEAVLGHARQRGVASVYLLTTTAERFFPRFGFVQVTRNEVPASVRQSVEFASACPASAIVMRATLIG